MKRHSLLMGRRCVYLSSWKEEKKIKEKIKRKEKKDSSNCKTKATPSSKKEQEDLSKTDFIPAFFLCSVQNWLAVLSERGHWVHICDLTRSQRLNSANELWNKRILILLQEQKQQQQQKSLIHHICELPTTTSIVQGSRISLMPVSKPGMGVKNIVTSHSS